MPSDWDTVYEIAANDFESLVADGHPEVGLALDFLRGAGLRLVMLSGSGGACFGLATGASEASSTAQRLSDELGWRVLATRTLDKMPPVFTSVTLAARGRSRDQSSQVPMVPQLDARPPRVRAPADRLSPRHVVRHRPRLR